MTFLWQDRVGWFSVGPRVLHHCLPPALLAVRPVCHCPKALQDPGELLPSLAITCPSLVQAGEERRWGGTLAVEPCTNYTWVVTAVGEGGRAVDTQGEAWGV